MLTPLEAQADGTHNVQVCIRNDTDGKLKVESYNGSDGSCIVAHKSDEVKPGNTIVMKCHGQGKNRCKIKAGTIASCKNFDDKTTVRVYAVKNVNEMGWTEYYDKLPDVPCD